MSIETITEMFTYMRPMGSDTEQAFVDRYLSEFKRDEYLNLVLTVGKKPRILFSSHMDTVHDEDGMNQTLKFDGQFLTQTGHSCLGADDTAGVWLMLQMIEAKIPGVYVIHHGEERGCIGSRNLAKGNPDFLKGIEIAIAFDRAYYDDIITHQLGRRTASDAFALSFATQLGGSYKPSPEGVYTDTVEYAALVPECTNISVGYSGQHSKHEKQDVPFLMSLRDALLQVDWDQLVVERDPSVQEVRRSYFSPARFQEEETLVDLISEYPELAADIITAMGLTKEDFLLSVEESYGVAA